MTAISQKGVLLPFQTRWTRDKATVKVAEKSRQIGFSWSEAADDTLYAASTSGRDVWYIGYNQDMAQEFIRDCAFWARHFHEAASEMQELVLDDDKKEEGILSYRITFASGHRITALSSRPSNLRGKRGRVVIDEAAFHSDLSGLIKAAIALTMWGGDVRIMSTHFGDDNPFNDLVEDIRTGKKPFSLHRVTFDEALEEGLYKQICLSLKREWSPEAEAAWRQQLVEFYGEDADEELFCIPSGGSGVFLSRALILSCMDEEISVVRWKCEDGFAQKPDAEREAIALAWIKDYLDPILDQIDPNRKTYFGEDFGRSGDLTYILPAQEDQKLHYRSICAIELRDVPFRQQEQILFYVVDRLPRFSGGAMDARGNGQYLAEVAMQRYGASRIRQVMPSRPWYQDAMPKYKSHLEDQTILLPKDSDLLADNRLVRMTKGIAKVPDDVHTKGADGGQRHGDGAIAGAMLVHAIENDAEWHPEFDCANPGSREFSKMGGF